MKWMTKPLYNMIAKARQETFELNGWILITVDLAKEFLKLNIRNYRPVMKNVIDKYSKDIAKGLWEKNGEAIVISKDGVLRNGQHRLNGIIKSGVPALMYMIFDADNCVMFDMQSKRSCRQIIRDLGHSVSNLTPAVSRAVLLGKIGTSIVGDNEVCNYAMNNIDALKKAEGIVKTKVGKAKVVASKTSCATIAYCMLRTGEVSENELRDFFKVMNSNCKCGVKRDVSSAIVLRRQIESYAGHGDNLSNRFMEFTYLALMDFHNNVHVDRKFIYSDTGNNAKRLIREVQCMDGFCSVAA